jgi:hypothetical protein
MSKVSFSDSDITKIRFSSKVKWGGDDRFTIIEENFLKYSFDCENISATDEDFNRLKGLLIQIGVHWEGDLQFIKDDDKILVKSTFNSISADDDIAGATLQVDGKGAYVFAKKIGQIKLDDNSKKAILSFDGKKSYEFIEKVVSLGTVMAVYRNLRENYEFRLRYDEAGKFFIKEMELKRRYREEDEKNTSGVAGVSSKTVPNGWLRRNLSLTGLYYHLSRYGEDLLRPTLVGIVIVFLSTLFWLMQSKPILEPHFFVNSSLYNSTSHFVYLNQTGNLTQWQKAFERSLSDLIPLLPSGSKVEIGLLDYVIKIAGGTLTFGLIAIALRRKFERKYTH